MDHLVGLFKSFFLDLFRLVDEGGPERDDDYAYETDGIALSHPLEEGDRVADLGQIVEREDVGGAACRSHVTADDGTCRYGYHEALAEIGCAGFGISVSLHDRDAQRREQSAGGDVGHDR